VAWIVILVSPSKLGPISFFKIFSSVALQELELSEATRRIDTSLPRSYFSKAFLGWGGLTNPTNSLQISRPKVEISGNGTKRLLKEFKAVELAPIGGEFPFSQLHPIWFSKRKW
jgi:hypothetical protein